MTESELKQYRAYAHNPYWNDPLYLVQNDAVFKEMRKWQRKCLYNFAIDDDGEMVRLLSVQAFCGSGKSVLQVQLAIYDIVSSDYTQKQLIAVPQQHIHRGFVGENDLDYLSVIQDGEEYQWSIQSEHNFCDGKDRVDGLIEWLLTPSSKLAKGFTENTIGGLNAICSHAALIAAWKKLDAEQKKLAIENTTFRIDEAHHIKNVFLDVDEMTDEERLVIDYEATELGRFCTYLINSDVETCKLHLTTATMYRGDRHMILSAGVRGLFVEYNLDWIEHFYSLGIRDFFLQYELYDQDPISQILNQLRLEPNEKHYIVVPSLGNKWRDAEALGRLLNGIYQILPKARVLDLVTKETQQANKEKLLREPKVKSDSNPSMYDVVVVCMLGREGTDWCPCSRIHNASVENSITLAVQTAGRLFRRYEGKENVKIFHYVKTFTDPAGITKRELFVDRTNGLLVCMQFDDVVNPIIISALPGQESGKKGSQRNTLMDVFGDQYQNAKTDLIHGYELLEVKSRENITALAERICEEYDIENNFEAVRDALIVRLLRNVTDSNIPTLQGIDVSWLRTEGNFDKLKLVNSIYFGNFGGEDWQAIRRLLKGYWMEMYEEVKRIGVLNVKPSDSCSKWLLSQRKQYFKEKSNVESSTNNTVESARRLV